jgi:hypothetical protein
MFGTLIWNNKIRYKKRINILGKNGSREHCIGNKTVPKTVAITHTEVGHRQNTKSSTAIQTERNKEHRET